MPISPDRLERVLNPKVIAVVGDKKASGYMWLNALKTFSGNLYSIQVDEKEIEGIAALGVPNFASLTQIPEPVDYVLCAVPRKIAPFIVKDCIAAKVGGVTLFTSGFAETGEDEGLALQDQIGALARDADLLLIGPNCMGIHNPGLGVRFHRDQPHGRSGNVGFISQSGTHGMHFSLVGATRGIYCSKLVSFGNGIILEAADYLDYLANDDATEIIGMYIEGARDGRRFVQALRAAAARKPVVIWKGGQTDAGSTAAQSHTASLASNKAVWDAIVRQAGAISVAGLDELVDVVHALQRTKPGRGNRVGLMAMTGGQSVALADSFAREGWQVPRFADATYAQLAEFFNVIGGSYQNPLDMAGTIMQDASTLDRLFDLMEADPNVDAVAMEISATFAAQRWEKNPQELETLIGSLRRFQERSDKPFVAALHPSYVEQAALNARDQLQAAGLPVFPSFERAANALAKSVALDPALHPARQSSGRKSPGRQSPGPNG
ncbi:MAG: Acyl-CoA synthetase (NDP forming) [Chloroflexi bacterium]|jgi:acyl-CoA synthetase (NDP forming)|nr:MAG: Acyl-CoA synthetase (NDP forming) [Chloroflexota bacterium]